MANSLFVLIARPKGSDQVIAPRKIWLGPEKIQLSWRPWDEKPGKYRKASLSAELLDDFRAVGSRTEEDSAGKVLEFARRYSILGLCRHGLPQHHRWVMKTFRRSPGASILRQAECDLSLSESIAHWQALARAATALIELSNPENVHSDSDLIATWERASWLTRKRHNWSKKLSFKGRRGSRRRGKRFVQQLKDDRKSLLATCVNDWMECGGLQVRLSDDLSQYQLKTQSVGIFAALAVYLANEVFSGGRRIRYCAQPGCEAEITGRELRNASPNRSYYCLDHKDVAQKEAVRRYRAKVRNQKAEQLLRSVSRS